MSKVTSVEITVAVRHCDLDKPVGRPVRHTIVMTEAEFEMAFNNLQLVNWPPWGSQMTKLLKRKKLPKKEK